MNRTDANKTPSPLTGKVRALGRGLDALLPPARLQGYGDKSVFACPIERIAPQKGQPRQHFAQLDELAASLKENGLLEPLVVRRTAEDRYEIIAGERRWRAAQKAGLKEVLVVVKDVTPERAFVLAILENVQREDLNPVELAEAYDRLIKEHAFTQETVAQKVGKDRSTVANALRLLRLPQRVREKIIQGELSEGHARALLGATGNLDEIAERVIRGKLSVRDTEALVRRDKVRDAKKTKGAEKSKSASIRDLEARLMRVLGTKCEVRDRGNKGEISIPYTDLDHLDRILGKIIR
jgi:ParB family transcriptional regulator, chromosome partitioning protein